MKRNQAMNHRINPRRKAHLPTKDMHLPTAQFSQLAASVALRHPHPALDLLVSAWDHVAARHLRRLPEHHPVLGRIQSIRHLAVHDAVQAVLDPGYGYVYHGESEADSIPAALAAVAKASHDILSAVFDTPEAREDIASTLDESLSLLEPREDLAEGVRLGAESAAAYARIFGPLSLDAQLSQVDAGPAPSARYDELGHGAFGGWRRSA